jgi:hypothetical protein
MKRALVGILTLAACTLAFAGIAAAAVDCGPSSGGSGDLAGVKIGLHAIAFNDVKACAAKAPAAFGCDSPSDQSSLVVNFPINTRASVYVVALDIPTGIGLKGATFGLDYFAYNYNTYTGIYCNAFNLCADLQFPSVTPAFPGEPGSGVVVTSNACLGTVADGTDPQGEGFAILGWLDATSYDYVGTLAVTPRLYLPTPDFQVANCVAAASNPCYPDFAGTLGFGGPGYQPCVGVVATEPTTWSKLKQMGE